MAQSVSERRAVVRCPFCLTLNKIDLARLADGPKCGDCGRPLLLDRPVRIGLEDLDRVVEGTDVPVLVDFYADWCGPCRAMAPLLDDFAREHTGGVLVAKLDTDANPGATERFGIRGIPTLVAFREGKESGRHVGLATRADLARLTGLAAP